MFLPIIPTVLDSMYIVNIDTERESMRLKWTKQYFFANRAKLLMVVKL